MASRSRCHKPWRGLLGAPCPAVIRQEQVCAVWVALLPCQSAPGGGHPCHHRSCQRASHKDVSERGWHRTAAGVRADVLSPRARARPAKERPDTQLAVEDPPSQDALTPVQAPVRDHLPCLPQGTGALGCRAARSCKSPAQVEAAAAEAAGALLRCRTAAAPAWAAAAAALGASRPHLWRGLARPSCGCLQKALLPEPRLPSPSSHRGSMTRRPLRESSGASAQMAGRMGP